MKVNPSHWKTINKLLMNFLCFLQDISSTCVLVYYTGLESNYFYLKWKCILLIYFLSFRKKKKTPKVVTCTVLTQIEKFWLVGKLKI